MAEKISTLEANPLGHVTGDLAISQFNYESILNGLVEWDSSHSDKVTIRLATNADPYFVDYTFGTKYAMHTNDGNNAITSFLDPGCFAYNERTKFAAMYDKENPDSISVRISVNTSPETQCELYADCALYDNTATDPDRPDKYLTDLVFRHSYAEGLYFKTAVNNSGRTDIATFKTLISVQADTDMAVGSNCVPYIVDFSDSTYSYVSVIANAQLVRFNGSVYSADGDIAPGYDPDNPKSGYIKFCDVYSSSNSYKYGTLVEFRGTTYIYVADLESSVPPAEFDTDSGYLYFNTDHWLPVVFKDVYRKANPGVVRYELKTDTVGFVVKNIGTAQTAENSDISIRATVKIPGGVSAQAKGVDIFKTSNYVQYPTDKSTRWMPNGTYGPTDTSIGVYGLQNYTAVMVFNHADPETRKLNIINYNGPDLDQGLAIFLPVEVLDGTGQMVAPKDGSMFEFLFNIWPTPSLNGQEVNDLIINKAHIYVYNLTDYTDFDWTSRQFSKADTWPIAKFSMARLTNFHVFGENIAVDDKPVVYKARFIFAASENAWKLFDYYQFPDHVFMSPDGFVDPAARGENRVETGGFPLFQNPFSGSDLSPVQVSSDYFSHIVP